MYTQRITKKILATPVRLIKALKSYWQKSWLNKLVVFLIITAIAATGTVYGIGQWYINSTKEKPLVLGVTFIPAYAESMGLDPEETMDALINDLGVHHFRLVSYWNQIEPVQDQYNYELLDWQFAKAEAAGAKITLSLGLRQPRWPECHMPDWANNLPSGNTNGTWQDQLSEYIGQTVNRYKNSPSLASYQLENEFLLHGFSSACKDHDRERVANELALVKKQDPNHPVIISRSNNIGLPLGQPRPDLFGISVYRRNWDMHVNRYFQYPFPTWYYSFLAGAQKIITGKDSILHELQTEPWPPNGQTIVQTSLEEQNKSFNPKRFQETVQFGVDTGMRDIYLWGAEYWYYRMIELGDPSVWQVARRTFAPRDL